MVAKLCGPGGVRAAIAENLLLKQQLMVLRRARRRAAEPEAGDSCCADSPSLFLSPERVQKTPPPSAAPETSSRRWFPSQSTAGRFGRAMPRAPTKQPAVLCDGPTPDECQERRGRPRLVTVLDSETAMRIAQQLSPASGSAPRLRSTSEDHQLLFEQEILRNGRSYATGTAQLRDHYATVQQCETEDRKGGSRHLTCRSTTTPTVCGGIDLRRRTERVIATT